MPPAPATHLGYVSNSHQLQTLGVKGQLNMVMGGVIEQVYKRYHHCAAKKPSILISEAVRHHISYQLLICIVVWQRHSTQNQKVSCGALYIMF